MRKEHLMFDGSGHPHQVMIFVLFHIVIVAHEVNICGPSSEDEMLSASSFRLSIHNWGEDPTDTQDELQMHCSAKKQKFWL
jgi:hypothetical protein